MPWNQLSSPTTAHTTTLGTIPPKSLVIEYNQRFDELRKELAEAAAETNKKFDELSKQFDALEESFKQLKKDAESLKQNSIEYEESMFEEDDATIGMASGHLTILAGADAVNDARLYIDGGRDNTERYVALYGLRPGMTLYLCKLTHYPTNASVLTSSDNGGVHFAIKVLNLHAGLLLRGENISADLKKKHQELLQEIQKEDNQSIFEEEDL